ncbi:MAG: murein transglycosylase, partial [Flavobacteriaceae bacterium]|nr:murein transglycosylase [Flavobacteriaceae bacterium]
MEKSFFTKLRLSNNISLVAILFFVFLVSFGISKTRFLTNGNVSNYQIYPISIPKKVSFAGEEIILDENDLVERMDKELLVNTYWQSNTILLIKRANKYFPQIEKILVEEDVPLDFKYLALIESGLENVTSPRGAKGFWQIMKATGKEYGLEINSNVDERYNLDLSTRLACKYLKKAKDKFGSWTLAAAAYNRGINGVQNKISSQNQTAYEDILFGEQTKRYVFRIIALKNIVESPESFGFYIEKEQMYKPIIYKTIKIDIPINNLSDFS